MSASRATTVVDEERRLSMVVIDLVAHETGTDPLELEPLYDTIDPDVIDALVESDGFTSLEFAYEGRTIRVEDVDGDLRVSFADGSVTADSEPRTVDTGSSPSL
ncbi:HalOD1 output domain-containing protein [Natronobacterium texcoconense]|uniref:Halobacterial output domain-containing protein n=1 Tax=Natronobacterium texcoconense TaxID=1095778 RepID=A0A1H1IAY8_NATTX|nr:HalOD1 output domain-containing protein [Natronobacterium texcoconense]SDR34822.1 hypothetical protein SAMN04489842_3378 [Natronobacterium texcoconense]